MNEEIINRIKQLTDSELLDEIGSGKESFQDGVYEAYLQEAKDRKLQFDTIELANKTKERSFVHEAKGYAAATLLLIFLFIGLFSFIPAIQLLKKDKSGNLLYPEKYKNLAWTGIIISIIVWVTFISLLIYGYISMIK